MGAQPLAPPPPTQPGKFRLDFRPGFKARRRRRRLLRPVLTSGVDFAAPIPRRGGGPSVKSAKMRLKFFRQIGLFPGKTAFGVRRAAEVAIGGCARVDRPV